MDKLPPELLLKIAGYCDFAEVCAISKVNRRWNEMIESNCNSLKKAQVDRIRFSQDMNKKSIECEIWCNFGRKKLLRINVSEGSEEGNASKILEDGWISGWPDGWEDRVCFLYATPKEVGKFLEDLFAPIFRRSDILHFDVGNLNSSTLQILISLLERFRPTVGFLSLYLGPADNRLDRHDLPMELIDFARIVELCRPGRLEFCSANYFTKEEVCEGFLKKIANLCIPRVSMMGCYKHLGLEQGSILHGPLPKCTNLLCVGRISALDVPDIVDLVEEWSNNERDIEYYQLKYFSEDMSVVAAKFEQVLRERDLSVRFEIVQENVKFFVEKIVKRGDEQDRLELMFGHTGFLDMVIIRNDEQCGPLP